MTLEEYVARRKIIDEAAPNDWETSSFTAFQMFHAAKADALQNLDDEFRPPTRWQLLKRRWGL